MLKVASESENIMVTVERAHGEAEAINLELNTANILDGVSNTNLPSFNTEARLPVFLVSSVSVGELQIAKKWLFNFLTG